MSEEDSEEKEITIRFSLNMGHLKKYGYILVLVVLDLSDYEIENNEQNYQCRRVLRPESQSSKQTTKN